MDTKETFLASLNANLSKLVIMLLPKFGFCILSTPFFFFFHKKGGANHEQSYDIRRCIYSVGPKGDNHVIAMIKYMGSILLKSEEWKDCADWTVWPEKSMDISEGSVLER